MKEQMAYFLYFYDREIVKMIAEKYNIPKLEAFLKFIQSETYSMLSDIELEMWDYGFPAIFDMWECEQITGTPQTSVYLRGE